jgi:lactoylglutathione lyase
MREIRGIYEVAIPVRDLERAEKFYQGVLGLESGLRQEERRWHFLRAGGDAGMLVLQERSEAFAPTHYAFTTTEAEIDGAAERLRSQGIEVAGPVTHDWMPARSIYFSDPDGHELELCAPLARLAG